MSGLRAVQNVVILKPHKVPDTTAGGIVIPDLAKLRTCEGEVVAVGPGLKNRRGKHISLEVKVGDHVLYGFGMGEKMRWRGESYVVMREPDIDLIIDGPQGNGYDPAPYCETAEVSCG